MMMMMMMMIQAPLGSLFFSHQVHTGVAHHRPTGQGQAIRSMKGRGRPAVGRVARLLLLAGGLWPYLLPPPPMGWSGLVGSGL